MRSAVDANTVPASRPSAGDPLRAPEPSRVADLLLVVDSLAHLREVSPSVSRYLGHTRGELLGTDLEKLLHPDDIALLRSRLRGALGAEQEVLRFRDLTDRWHRFSIRTRMVPGPQRESFLIIEARDTVEREPSLDPPIKLGGCLPPGLGQQDGDVHGGEEVVNPELVDHAGSRSETVLVCLDDSRSSARACSIMRQLGYEVLEATCPSDAEGFARVHQGTIHLLVTDLATPRVPGRAFVRAMQTIRLDLKSLFVSRQGYGSLAERRVYESGARLLHVPFTPEELAHALRRALENNALP